MNIEAVKTIFFSPTGTTRRVIEAIAQGMSPKEPQSIDLTLPSTTVEKSLEFENDDVVILGLPVYVGRIPARAIRRLRGLKGKNTLAIIVVVYGNREYEDALLELKDLVLKAGLNPVAGGAFIGEHSFSRDELPIAQGRPDKSDIEKAEEFGKAIARKLAKIETVHKTETVTVPGNFPYIVREMHSNIAPITQKALCTLCKTCATVCPTGAITVNEQVMTDPGNCILCCACVKNCPTKARVLEAPEIATIAKWLHKHYHDRKEPEFFL